MKKLLKRRLCKLKILIKINAHDAKAIFRKQRSSCHVESESIKGGCPRKKGQEGKGGHKHKFKD